MSDKFQEDLRRMGVPQKDIDLVDRLLNATHHRLGINVADPEVADIPKVLFLYRVFSMMPIARVLGLESPMTAEILHAAADAIELAHKELNK